MNTVSRSGVSFSLLEKETENGASSRVSLQGGIGVNTKINSIRVGLLFNVLI
jgi:hypothetical protein